MTPLSSLNNSKPCTCMTKVLILLAINDELNISVGSVLMLFNNIKN